MPTAADADAAAPSGARRWPGLRVRFHLATALAVLATLSALALANLRHARPHVIPEEGGAVFEGSYSFSYGWPRVFYVEMSYDSGEHASYAWLPRECALDAGAALAIAALVAAGSERVARRRR